MIEEKIVKPIINTQIPIEPALQPVSIQPIPKTTIEKKLDEENQPEKEKTEEEIVALIPQADYRDSPLFYEIANYFGIEEHDYNNVKLKLAEITDWAIMHTKSNKIEDILPAIRELEDNLMKPTWGETRYGVVYRYLRLLNKKQAFDKVLAAFERNKIGEEVKPNGNP